MRKFIASGITVCLLVLFSFPAFAARDGVKGADQEACEHASDNAMFNRISDWFATRGKPEEEKQAIIAERKTKRAEKRARKEERRQAIIAERKTKRVEKRTRKEERKAKRGTERQGSRRQGRR